MLIWGQWDLVFNFWVSCGFCDAVAPDVQMRVCGKYWFEGNETLFLISESPVSPVAFVTLLPLMINDSLWEMLIWGQWDLVFNFWVSCVSCGFCDTVAPDVQMRVCGKCSFEGNENLFLISESPVSPVAFVTLLLLMLKWEFVGNVDLRAMRPCFNFWVSCVSCGFCDAVAPDVKMRVCWKCLFEGNETLFLISESPVSPVAFVTLLPLMLKWEFVGNVDLRAMRPCF